MTLDNSILIFIALGLIALGVILIAYQQSHTKSLFQSKKRLIRLLDKAEKIVSNYEGGYSGEYLSAQDFHKDLKSAIMDYKNGDDTKLVLFYTWFAPTSQWDDFVGKEGERIANDIYEIVNKLQNY